MHLLIFTHSLLDVAVVFEHGAFSLFLELVRSVAVKRFGPAAWIWLPLAFPTKVIGD